MAVEITILVDMLFGIKMSKDFKIQRIDKNHYNQMAKGISYDEVGVKYKWDTTDLAFRLKSGVPQQCKKHKFRFLFWTWEERNPEEIYDRWKSKLIDFLSNLTIDDGFVYRLLLKISCSNSIGDYSVDTIVIWENHKIVKYRISEIGCY